MSIVVYSVYFDSVIDSWFLNGETTYDFALKNIFPRIGEFDAQRKIQDRKFYQRLRKDIVRGCVMPPITISFVDRNIDSNLFNISEHEKIDYFANYTRNNIKTVYVLDGIQRLNTLQAASDDEGFKADRKILLNILISKSNDKLLYRMITLNNGQRPMTPRHQIEVLTKELFNFDGLQHMKIQTEKERGERIVRGAFNYVDISNAYLAFLTNNVNNENSKIIEEKMNEILVGRLFDSEISEQTVEFSEVLNQLDRFCADDTLKTWFKLSNNLIGFVVGYRKSYRFIESMSVDVLRDFISKFDEAFDAINSSKVNVGKFRRELSADFIENIKVRIAWDASEMMEYIATKTAQ